ncbi:uncharacterized protein LOC6737557 [Drosophila simulans]|uniref:GD12858 n=2 Tax=melanogaster subgroup TaxID=32351 RepID=B4QP77_DROSI|nr:uncharacterized protein LOC6737557 [Drosophila simulans]XP_033159911.1 uncharacterized protein LOC117140877 [Drosophila mauritiana]EDX09975.1 GD12858 [Drosophila simulans]KMY98852.1 uncharacterized protein Dsimw501_GD12858 [Drosophila simulans]
MGSNSDGYLVPCAYCIALLDFISALLFAIISGVVFARHGHWTALVALIFTIFWMVIIIVLMAGIYRRKLGLIRFWLVFTCLGILLDGFILLYGLTLAISVNWEGVKITVLPFVGLAVEMTFVYIIYLLYLDMIDYTAQESPREEKYRERSGCDVKYAEEEEKPLDRKDLKRMEKQAKERMKKDKAVLKKLQKQMRK